MTCDFLSLARLARHHGVTRREMLQRVIRDGQTKTLARIKDKPAEDAYWKPFKPTLTTAKEQLIAQLCAGVGTDPSHHLVTPLNWSLSGVELAGQDFGDADRVRDSVGGSLLALRSLRRNPDAARITPRTDTGKTALLKRKEIVARAPQEFCCFFPSQKNR